MSAKERFNLPLDFYTEEEWADLEENEGWQPALRVAERKSHAVVLQETPRGQ